MNNWTLFDWASITLTSFGVLWLTFDIGYQYGWRERGEAAEGSE